MRSCPPATTGWHVKPPVALARRMLGILEHRRRFHTASAGCSRSDGSFGVAPRSLSPAHRGQSVVTDENAAQKSPNESATCSYDGPSSPDRSLLQRTTCVSPEPQSKHRASLFASTANGRSASRRFSKADQKTLAEARSELDAVERCSASPATTSPVRAGRPSHRGRYARGGRHPLRPDLAPRGLRAAPGVGSLCRTRRPVGAGRGEKGP